MCRSASIVDRWSPISAISEDTVACSVSDDTLAKGKAIEAPSMSPTVMVDVVRVKARVIHPLLTTREKAVFILGKKWCRTDQNEACSNKC
jgi:hypothetical protein